MRLGGKGYAPGEHCVLKQHIKVSHFNCYLYLGADFMGVSNPGVDIQPSLPSGNKFAITWVFSTPGVKNSAVKINVRVILT